MGSSTGEVMWIDDLLDEVAAGPGVAALRELCGGTLGRHELADVVVRGTFLCSPTLQPLAFALDRLVQGEVGAGWTIARAWCLAQHAHERAEEAPMARTALVQSQLFRRALSRTVRRRDAASLASYLLGLCEAYLLAQAPGPAALPVLGGVLSSLGFPVASQVPSANELMGDAERPQPASAGRR